MHHLLAHAASPRIVRLRTHVEILLPELAPDAEHLDALRLVAVDQEVVRHNDFKYSTRRAAARDYNRDPAFLTSREGAQHELVERSCGHGHRRGRLCRRPDVRAPGVAAAAAAVGSGVQERPGAQRHSRRRIPGNDGHHGGVAAVRLLGLSRQCGDRQRRLGGRHAEEDHGAPDGEHGCRHQSEQLRWTPAGHVLDLPSQPRQAAHDANHRHDLWNAHHRAGRRGHPVSRSRFSGVDSRSIHSSVRRHTAPRGVDQHLRQRHRCQLWRVRRRRHRRAHCEGSRQTVDDDSLQGRNQPRRSDPRLRRHHRMGTDAAQRRRRVPVARQRSRRRPGGRAAVVPRSDQKHPHELEERPTDDDYGSSGADEPGDSAAGRDRQSEPRC